jgi:hypothetical protein
MSINHMPLYEFNYYLKNCERKCQIKRLKFRESIISGYKRQSKANNLWTTYLHLKFKDEHRI